MISYSSEVNDENVDHKAESKTQTAKDQIRTPGENFVPSPQREALYKENFEKMKSALNVTLSPFCIRFMLHYIESYGMRARKRPEVVKVSLPLLKTKENIDVFILTKAPFVSYIEYICMRI